MKFYIIFNEYIELFYFSEINIYIKECEYNYNNMLNIEVTIIYNN